MTEFEAIRRIAQAYADYTGRPAGIIDTSTRRPLYVAQDLASVTEPDDLVAIVQPGA